MYNTLIVDDDFRDCTGICNTIKKFDLPLNSFTADCGSAALEILEKEKINILITDIKMPDMLGINLAQQAKKSNPELIIILVSAYKDFQYAQSAISFGAMRYLLKPYSIKELVETLKEAIKNCELQSQKSADGLSSNQEHTNNNIVLSFLDGKNNVSPEQIKLILSADKIQLVSVKIIKSAYPPNEIYSKLKENFSSDLAIIPVQNSEYIILNQNAFGKKDFEHTLQIFRENYQTEICISYSPFEEIAELPKEYKRIKQLSEYFFFSSTGIIASTTDIAPAIEQNSLSADFLIDKINLFIDMGNYTDFLSTIDLFFETLKKNSHFSSLYTKSISANILNRIFKKHKFQETELEEKVAKIFSSSSAHEIVTIFKEIIDEIESDKNKTDTKRLISKTLSIIESDYMKDISLEYISEKLYVSPSHLSRLFRKETGKTFIEFLKEYRLKKACELLETTNLRVATIAKMVGYNSPSYFNTIFHKFFNVPPAQFREKGDW